MADNNGNDNNAFGIIKDGLKDASKIIGDKRFQKFLDYGSTALVVGSLLMSDENSKKALAVGLALKVGMGIYKAGGIKQYFDENVNSAKETFAEFKDFVEGKQDKEAVNKAYVSVRGHGTDIDYSDVSLDRSKSKFISEDKDRFKPTGISNFVFTVPADNRKDAITKVMACIDADFQNYDKMLSRKEFSLNGVSRESKGNYIVNCSVDNCSRAVFDRQTSFMHKFGDSVQVSPVRPSQLIDKDKSAIGDKSQIGIKGLMSMNDFNNDMKMLCESANLAKNFKSQMNFAELNKRNFENEFGTGQETGLKKVKCQLKGVSRFGSLKKFEQARSDLNKDCADNRSQYETYVSSLKSCKARIMNRFEGLNAGTTAPALDKGQEFGEKIDGFIKNLESDTVNRSGFKVPFIDESNNKLGRSGIPPVELAAACAKFTSAAGNRVKENNAFRIGQEKEIRKDIICNSPDILLSNKTNSEDYFKKKMKDIYAEQGRNTEVPNSLVEDMVGKFGVKDTEKTLKLYSSDHIEGFGRNAKSDVYVAAKAVQARESINRAVENTFGCRPMKNVEKDCITL